MTSTYLGKFWIHFLELLFLNCNEKAAFLFKDNYSKEEGPFLFEGGSFCYVWWFPFFKKIIKKLVKKPAVKKLRPCKSKRNGRT